MAALYGPLKGQGSNDSIAFPPLLLGLLRLIVSSLCLNKLSYDDQWNLFEAGNGPRMILSGTITSKPLAPQELNNSTWAIPAPAFIIH